MFNWTRLALPFVAVGPLLAPNGSTDRVAPPADPVVSWIERRATTIATAPDAPLGDLAQVGRVVGDATVVGIGESTHGSRQQFLVKHRLVRFLVERMGFRTLAFEDDFASGVLIDRYLVTGDGDPASLASGMSSPFWASEAIVDLLEWLRTYNEAHPHDPVRFLGSDLLQLRQSSFDAVADHVGHVAPERLPELQQLLEPIRLRGAPFEQFQWYLPLSDAEQTALIDTARHASQLVADLPRRGDPVERQYAEQHARAILGWYENYATDTGFRGAREEFIADSIRWWQSLTDHRIAYWAANVHTSSAPRLTFRTPDEEVTGTMAGGLIEGRLGRRYVSIGTWFHAGTISSDFTDPGPQRIGPPGDELLESTLGRASGEHYLLSLTDRVGDEVRSWLDGSSTMRVILPSYVETEDGDAYSMTVPDLNDAFDAAVFVRHTTASRLLGSP